MDQNQSLGNNQSCLAPGIPALTAVPHTEKVVTLEGCTGFQLLSLLPGLLSASIFHMGIESAWF